MLAMTGDVVLSRNEWDGGTRSRRGTRCATLEPREVMGPKYSRTRQRGKLARSRMTGAVDAYEIHLLLDRLSGQG